jgi:hypothetical protein
MIIFGSCGAERAPAEETPSPDGPARVVLLADDTAKAFLDGTWAASGEPQPPPPPDGAVLVAGDDVNVFAFVLGRTEAAAAQLLEEIAFYGEIEECEPEGVTCCDEANGMWVLDSGSAEERFWLRLGQHCALSPIQEGWTDDVPSRNDPGVAFVEVRPDLWAALAKEGVAHPLMTLAGANRERRVLVKPSWRSGENLLPSPLMDRAGLRTSSPIILANHIRPPQPPPAGCATVNYCKSADGRRCSADVHPRTQPHGNTRRHHWYSKDDTTGEWCEETDRCGCQP